MAVTESRQLYNPQVEALMGKYATAVGDRAAKAFTTADIQKMAPKVVKPTGLQQQATTLAGQGIGAYQPYVAQAGTQLGLGQTGLTGVETGLGQLAGTYAAPAVQGIQDAQTTLGGVPSYITAAGQQLGAAGTTGTLGAAAGQLTGAQTAMAGVDPYIQQAAGLTGTGANLAAAGAAPTAGSIADYMSPYQSQVIQTTLDEFDKQAQMRQQQISDAAVAMGGFGGGREGVMQSEYQLGSDKNRAALEAQLLNQGYSQAAAARQADMASRLGIGQAQAGYAQGLAGLAGQRAGLAGQEAGLAQAQLGLGGAQQALAGAQLGAGQAYLQPGQFASGVLGQQAGAAGQRAALGQQQLGIAGAEQGFRGADIARVGQVGAVDQAQLQAEADAQREFDRMRLYEPYERIGWLGQGLMGMMGGMAPQYQFSQQPNASPLAQALGIAATGAGAYKAFGGS
jgi:hypothetical protein